MISLAILLAVNSVSAGTPRPAVTAWVAPWEPISSQGWECFSEINPFVFAFDSEDKIALPYAKFLAEAVAAKPPRALLVPTVVNDVFGKNAQRQTLKSVPLLVRLLKDDESINAHVDELLRLSAPYNGLEIDYEKIPSHRWGEFATLIERLGQRLRERGKKLGVDLEPGPVMRGDPGVQGAWRRIGAAADRVSLMAYYQRGAFSDSPGPGNSLPWIETLARKTLELIPPDKLALAYSLAGTDWRLPHSANPLKRAVKRVHYRDVVALRQRTPIPVSFDEAESTPRLRYFDAKGVEHELWFEDERSLKAKYELAAALGVSRVSLWYLAHPRPDLAAAGLCLAPATDARR